jgi:hypothetical protein
LSEETPKYIRKLEEDVENLRTETNAKIEDLTKKVASVIEICLSLIGKVADYTSSVSPKTQENTIAQYRFLREVYRLFTDWEFSKETGMQSTIDVSFKGALSDELKRSATVPFDNVIDVLLRGLGTDMVRRLVSPDLIAEFWGAQALERFKKMLSEKS